MSFRVVALIAAHNEDDVIAQVLADLIAQGVEIYLIDHASTDSTVAEATPLLGKGLLHIERYPEESGFPASEAMQFAWKNILLRKQQLGRELDASWFLHHDADELRESPWDGVGLRDAIARVDALGYNAIDFRALDFPPTHDGFRRGDDLRRTFGHCRPVAEYDRLQIKAWKKLQTPVDLTTSGGHEAVFAGRRVFPVRFLLRHYPIRSQGHGERKVMRERLPRYAASERAAGWHVQYDDAAGSFLADPAALEPFDPGRVRAELAVDNRDLEALRPRLERSEAQAAAFETDLLWFRREWPARERELVQATAERDEAARQAESLRQHAANLELRLDEVSRHAANLEGMRDEIERHRDSLARHAADLERVLEIERQEANALRQRLADLLGSLSWRLTLPLRAVLRLVRGR